MKNLLVVTITLFTFNSFAVSNSSEKIEAIQDAELIHVYCDGVYAGDIYAMENIEDTIEMAQAMCD